MWLTRAKFGYLPEHSWRLLVLGHFISEVPPPLPEELPKKLCEIVGRQFINPFVSVLLRFKCMLWELLSFSGEISFKLRIRNATNACAQLWPGPGPRLCLFIQPISVMEIRFKIINEMHLFQWFN